MTLGSLFGIDVVVVPDDDARMKDVPPGSAGVQGCRMLIRESQWPAVREALRRETGATPASPTSAD